MLRRILLLILAGLLSIGLYGWREAVSDPRVITATMVIPQLPRGTPDMRLALVSDIHVGNWAMPVARLDRIVTMIDALHPDVILLAGDFVNGQSYSRDEAHPELLVAPLSRLHAPLGVFAVRGNHDGLTWPEEIAATLRRAGVTVLANHAARIGPIALVGIDDRQTMRADIPAAMADAAFHGGVPVVMGHDPGLVPFLPAGIPLALFGHTHCGQIVLGTWFHNAWDPINMRPRFDDRYRCGLVRDEWPAAKGQPAMARTVIVTGGVGAATLMPIRLGAPPDLWMITLRAPA